MLNTLVAVIVYECLVALIYILCWRLVREVDTRLPIAASSSPEAMLRTGVAASGSALAGRLGPHWQVFAILLGSAVLAGVALSFAGVLADLRSTMVAADRVSAAWQVTPVPLQLILPVGHLLILLVLFLRFRNSVQFPAIVVHLFLIVFCLLVTVVDPDRLQSDRLTLVPIFATNLVLLILTHGLLTLLFCRRLREVVAAVILGAVAGAILALGTMVISVVSTLMGGPLFFLQLYLVSAFGIFGIYFCVSAILLALWTRD